MPVLSNHEHRGGELLAALLIVLVGVALYGHTLHVPWYLDDQTTIVENPLVRDIGAALQGLFARRGVATLSFALNHHFGGLNLPGFHLVNIALHVVTSWLAFRLFRRMVPASPVFALFGALIFLAHPLQTQAVTYVVQRMTGLCAFFFFLALWLFVRAREALAADNGFVSFRHLPYYLGAIGAGVLAVFSKEIALVLPVALILFCRYFLDETPQRQWRPLLLAVTPFLLISCLFITAKLLLPLAGGGRLDTLMNAEPLVSMQGISPLRYLVTEFSVLWLYIRLLFFPFGQAFDHNYPVVTTFITLRNIAAFSGLAGLGLLAFRLRARRPLISFGITWFFLTLCVESTILPLDPLFEHRLYLPMFGFAAVILGLLDFVRGTVMRGVVMMGMLAVLSLLTWQRNALWARPVALFEDNLRAAPRSERVLNSLGVYYEKEGRFAEAEAMLRKSMEINPKYLNNYVVLPALYINQGRFDEAERTIRDGITALPDYLHLYSNLGYVYMMQGKHEEALACLEQVLTLVPNDVTTLNNRGRLYFNLNRFAEAEASFRQGLLVNPQNAVAHADLALVLVRQGRIAEAEAEFVEAARSARRSAGPPISWENLSREIDDVEAVRHLAQALVNIDPDAARILGASADAQGAAGGGASSRRPVP